MAMVIMKRGRDWREMKDDIDVEDDEEYQFKKKKAKSFSTKVKLKTAKSNLAKVNGLEAGNFDRELRNN